MHVYFLPITSDYTAADAGLLDFISAERRAQIARYPKNDSKKLSLYAALLTRMILSKISDIPVSELRFSRPKNKKPVLLNDPSVHFNISHTKGGILCGFASDHLVGVDIEAIQEIRRGVVRKTFHPEEIVRLGQNDIVFTKIWTRKEAYTKWLGTGIACDLTAINTLSEELSVRLKTWQEGSFICSACGNLAEFQKSTVTEDAILQFYSSL